MAKDISEEDKKLFRSFVEKGKCLDKDSPVYNESIKDYPLSDYIAEPVFAETVLSYSPSSLPKKQFHALKSGSLPWEARLDLHGLTIENSRRFLIEFIQIQSQHHKRCVLIVHGKGGHHGEPPFIKNLVNRWLPQFDEVLGYHSARPKDGGAGAVYVLLKTSKENECLR